MSCRDLILKPHYSLVAGILFLCIFFGTPLSQAMDIADARDNYKNLQTNFIFKMQKLSKWNPDKVFVTSSERMPFSFFNNVPSARPVNEKIALNVTHPKEQVQDIEAINTVKQRTIVFDDVQRGDRANKGNSLDIGITGNRQDKQSMMDVDDESGNAIKGGMNHEENDKIDPIRSQVNNLNIDISGISVRAINTMPGGAAIATSNINIKPVQIIVKSSEASEKLK
ncbi:MAG: hypothetical protein A4E49_01206 [Methanosaeta sp. PtaU1.Bin112]|nr:MAG: hypothetical protein A4E49_01206 [Methanosaeta sp. PtaU1.Bin112]